MIRTRFWLAATILAAIILLGFVLSVPHTHDIITRTPLAATQTSVSPALVLLHDAYTRGIHTITGALRAPDSCTTATATSTLIGTASTSQSILVAISMPKDVGVCLQEPATTTFSTTISAPAGIPLRATLNGAPATTTP